MTLVPDLDPLAPPAPEPAFDHPFGDVPEQAEGATPPRRPRRTRLAALATAGLLVAGGAGAAVATWLQDGAATPTAAGVVTRDTTPLPAGTGGSPEAAATAIGPSVVTIEVSGTAATTSNGFLRGGAQQVSDTGSGVVLRADGYILTNNHVVAAAVGGGTVHVTLADGATVPATIVGTDETSDLAVVKVTGVAGLTAATFSDSDALKVGQAVLAVGAPLGLSNTVTQGIVSTIHRPVATGEQGASAQSVIDAVQTDAAINPGNSGGALVDLAGRVVGINSAIATTGSSTGNVGVGFAIPANDAVKVADQLIAAGKAVHSQIGISVQDTASATDGAPGLGATVGQVTPGGPAAKAGLQPGDVITKLDGRVVTDADSLIVAVRSHDPGATVTVTYTRAGATRTASATLVSSGG